MVELTPGYENEEFPKLKTLCPNSERCETDANCHGGQCLDNFCFCNLDTTIQNLPPTVIPDICEDFADCQTDEDCHKGICFLPMGKCRCEDPVTEFSSYYRNK